MYLIFLLGLFFRLSFINKPQGLWNDEYVSWMIANTSFKDGFWQEVFNQCHMPFYYFYIKPFTQFSDIILRLTSVVPSLISIVIMYLVGKEYSKKTGIYSAIITSVLSFLIYYSQEVRFYSILFLFSALSLLFTLRIVKKCNKHNIYGYVMSNILILFTHVLGFLYVFLNLLYIAYKKKFDIKKIIISISIIIMILIPFGINILKQSPSSQWWGHFSYTNILFLFTDFLSPILTNHVNAPSVFFYNHDLALWLTIPTIMGLIGLVFGVKNYKGISLVALFTVIIMSLISTTGKIIFITKYAIEILPIVLFLIAVGYSNLKKCGLVLLGLFIAFHLSAYLTPYYVTKIPRNEGHKIVGDILNYRKPKNILFTYYAPNRFYRYLNISSKMYYISKINSNEYIDNPSIILKDIKKNDTLSIVFLDSVSFLPENMITNGNIPIIFRTFSHIKNSLLFYLDNEYQNFYVDKVGSWTVITCTKK